MKGKNYYWGILLLLAAAFLITSRLFNVSDNSIFSIIATVIMIAIIVKSLKPVNFAGILFPIAMICIIYDEQLHITAITPWTVVIAAFLGSIGLSMIFGTHNHHFDNSKDVVVENDSSDEFSASSTFGETIKYVNSENFKKANVNCSFASMKLYFDNAQITEGKALINLDVSFGGVELYIPHSWNIVIKTKTSFSGITEKNKRNYDNSDSPVVEICGSLSFAGVDIFYV